MSQVGLDVEEGRAVIEVQAFDLEQAALRANYPHEREH